MRYFKVMLLLFAAVSVQAQQFNSRFEAYNSWSVGAHAGHVLTFGEYLGGRGDNASFDLAFGGNVSYQLNPVFGLRADFHTGSATGGHRALGLEQRYFENSFSAGQVSVMAYLANLVGQRKSSRWFLPYATVGLGYTLSSAQTFDGATGMMLTDTSSNSLALPVSLGGLVKLTDRLALDLRVSANMQANSGFDGEFALSSDQYLFSSVGLRFALGKNPESVEWTNPMDQMYLDLQSMKSTVDEISSDIDKDGVPDRFDQDNNTPEGVRVDGSGRPMDIDGDQIPDYMDVDPFTPRGAKVDGAGQAVDSDKDGVPDGRDLEPNSRRGALVNFQGVTIPATGGAIANSFIPSIFFSLESSTVNTSSYERLSIVGKIMKTNSSVRMRVIGHTDPSGSETYNEKLSQRRAQAVIDHLVKFYGIPADRFEIGAMGETQQLNESYQKINRRVDFEIIP